MVLLKKNGSRKVLDQAGRVDHALYPNGVGGIDGTAPCVSIDIGDHRLFMRLEEFRRLNISVEKNVVDIMGGLHYKGVVRNY